MKNISCSLIPSIEAISKFKIGNKQMIIHYLQNYFITIQIIKNHHRNHHHSLHRWALKQK
jgi:hypothetical protein